MHAYIHAQTYINSCIHEYIPACTLACIHIFMHTCLHALHAFTHSYIHPYPPIYVHKQGPARDDPMDGEHESETVEGRRKLLTPAFTFEVTTEDRELIFEYPPEAILKKVCMYVYM